MRVRDEQKAATRERLIDAAGMVIAAKGLDGASVSEISATAGVTTGALYASFDSKAALVGAFLKERNVDLSELPLDTVASDLGERLEEALESSPLSARLVVALLEAAGRHPDVLATMRESVMANVEALALRIATEHGDTRLGARETAMLLQVLVAGTIALREVVDLPPSLLTSAVQALL